MSNKVTVAIQTLGCKLNQADSEDLAQRLSDAGYELVPHQSPADIYILNGCTVTSEADRKCRNALRRARTRSGLVFASGCYSRSPVAPGRPEENVVSCRGDSTSLAEMVMKHLPPSPNGGTPRPVSPRRTRSFVKIQQGCEYRCTYCIVPAVRGKAVSFDASVIVSEVARKCAEGFQEVVLTGTNVGAYSSNGLDLGGLVRRLLACTSITRLRLSSLQPADVNEALVAALADPRMCRHVHMPLQSGSRAVLARMGRRYSLAEFGAACSSLRAVNEMAITTDIIAGFPGETDEEHQESLSYCREVGFAAVHVFPYSPRPGTPAARLPHLPGPLVRRRTGEFLALARIAGEGFRRSYVGRQLDVLWEAELSGQPGYYSGLTSNYIRVRARSQRDITNRVLPVTLIEDRGGWVRGELELQKTLSHRKRAGRG
ncbi:MAG: MiaB/RimO family radical SAM methylthiotransferase [Chloroflexi bacterium]|nr:MiaB/RimO family radical SAM methylthiotransferase [Chloroflexota bacterium]